MPSQIPEVLPAAILFKRNNFTLWACVSHCISNIEVQLDNLLVLHSFKSFLVPGRLEGLSLLYYI